MIRRWIILSLCLLIFGACNLSKVPSGFSEPILESRTKEAVEALHRRDVTFVYDQFRADIQAMITLEDFAQIIEDKYQRVGAFERFDVIAYNQTKDPSGDEIYAVVILNVIHASGRATYTISYDAQYQIVGFYIQ
jgi:hypothetical protein